MLALVVGDDTRRDATNDMTGINVIATAVALVDGDDTRSMRRDANNNMTGIHRTVVHVPLVLPKFARSGRKFSTSTTSY